jgi:hypothetical protein
VACRAAQRSGQQPAVFNVAGDRFAAIVEQGSRRDRFERKLRPGPEEGNASGRPGLAEIDFQRVPIEG